MRKYSVLGSNTSGTTQTLISLLGASTIRPAVYDILVGSSATPADQAMKVALTRFATSAGTSTAYTPNAIDPADVAAQTVAGVTHTVEPSGTLVNVLQFSINQRATFRWISSPESYILGSATTNNGLGLRIVSATASVVMDGTVLFSE